MYFEIGNAWRWHNVQVEIQLFVIRPIISAAAAAAAAAAAVGQRRRMSGNDAQDATGDDTGEGPSQLSTLLRHVDERTAALDRTRCCPMTNTILII